MLVSGASGLDSCPVLSLMSQVQLLHFPLDGLLLLLENSSESALLDVLDILLCSHLIVSILIFIVLLVSQGFLFLFFAVYLFLAIDQILFVHNRNHILLENFLLLNLLFESHICKLSAIYLNLFSLLWLLYCERRNSRYLFEFRLWLLFCLRLGR